jgi:hypothetical protein
MGHVRVAYTALSGLSVPMNLSPNSWTFQFQRALKTPHSSFSMPSSAVMSPTVVAGRTASAADVHRSLPMVENYQLKRG